MTTDPDIRQSVLRGVGDAMSLHLAYVGIVNDLLEALHRLGGASASQLAEEAGQDPGYVERWCDAAFAFELLDDAGGARFALTARGEAFRPGAEDTLMPFAVHAVLGAHMAERAAELMPSGERPGESVLAERATILPWFGPMLEAQFGPFFEQHILPALDVFQEVDRQGGLAVDLGCGNGWYVRRLAARYPNLRGIGLDTFEENIAGARRLAERDGVADRVELRVGDLSHFAVDEPVDLIAMNRALHHVWDRRDEVMRVLREHLRPGGAAVLWEPAWPADRTSLRRPDMRPMAFQNLAEHVQGNHFLQPTEIAAALEAAGLEPEVHLFADGKEAVVTGRRPA